MIVFKKKINVHRLSETFSNVQEYSGMFRNVQKRIFRNVLQQYIHRNFQDYFGTFRNVQKRSDLKKNERIDG